MIEWLIRKLGIDPKNTTPRKIIFTLLFLFVAVFLFVSFVSFLFSWNYDQSELQKDFFDIALQDEVEEENEDVQNAAGVLGAHISKFFIHNTFGVSSFALVVALFFIALRFWWQRYTTENSPERTEDEILRANKRFDRRFLLNTFTMMLLGTITLGFCCNTMCDCNLGGFFGYQFGGVILKNIFGGFLAGAIIFVAVVSYICGAFKPKFIAKFNPFKKKHPIVAESPEKVTEPMPETIPEVETEKQTIEEEIPIVETPKVDEIQENLLQNVEEQVDDSIVQELQEEQEIVDEPADLERSSVEIAENQEEVPVDDVVDEIEQDDEKTLDPNDEETDDVTEDLDSNDDFATDDDVDEENAESEPSVENQDANAGGMTIIVKETEDGEDTDMVLQDYDPKAELSHYKHPDVDLLKIYDNDRTGIVVDEDEQLENKNKIEQTLLDYGIEIDSISAVVGPTVTMYEIVLKRGTAISRVQSRQKEIMMGLAANGIRIIAPIPGKTAIGIEVPNKKREVVSMYSVINSKAFKESTMELPVALGKTITNDVYMFDLAKTPHLLVAGSTGQGKSVGLNAIVSSLLFKKHPSQLKFVMVDPKMVEFSIYGALKRHFMAKYPGEEDIILTDCTKVITTLNSLCIEMDDRYKLLMEAKCRNIIEYNEKFIHRKLSPAKGHKYLPYIVIIIDEYSDFMMQAGKEIEAPIMRIAQKARAVGMHMILATQQPSAKTVTSGIKTNFPSRIAFRTASNTDSMIILGRPGAEGLVGKGDLLISYAGQDITRVQSAFIDTPEVERLVDYISKQQGYGEPMDLPEVKDSNSSGGSSDIGNKGAGALDDKFIEAAQQVIDTGSASTSALQRTMEIGFNRAGRIMDQLQRYGVVGGYNGAKPREVLVDRNGLEVILNGLRDQGILK